MTVEELQALLASGVRPRSSWTCGRRSSCRSAPFPFPVHHVPMREVPQRLGEIPGAGAGRRRVPERAAGARRSSSSSVRNGVPGAVNLEGGILAWANRIDPSVHALSNPLGVL